MRAGKRDAFCECQTVSRMGWDSAVGAGAVFKCATMGAFGVKRLL